MDEEERKAIGGKIKQARKALGLKQVDVARELGISRTDYHNFETGKTIPAYLLLKWLSKKKVSMDWIFTGTGEMFLSQVRYDRDVQQMLDDFEKFPVLKHYTLSEHFMYREKFFIIMRKGKK